LSLSKSESNFLAFIDNHLFNSRATDGDDPDVFTSRRYDSGPVLFAYTADGDKPRLIGCLSGDFDQIGISPERLSMDEINATLFQIHLAFSLIEFENEHGMKTIPLLRIDQNGGLLPSFIPSQDRQTKAVNVYGDDADSVMELRLLP